MMTGALCDVFVSLEIYRISLCRLIAELMNVQWAVVLTLSL